MGYPTTDFYLYTNDGYKACIRIVGDATKQWADIVDAIVSNFQEITAIKIFRMNGT